MKHMPSFAVSAPCRMSMAERIVLVLCISISAVSGHAVSPVLAMVPFIHIRPPWSYTGPQRNFTHAATICGLPYINVSSSAFVVFESLFANGFTGFEVAHVPRLLPLVTFRVEQVPAWSAFLFSSDIVPCLCGGVVIMVCNLRASVMPSVASSWKGRLMRGACIYSRGIISALARGSKHP